MVGGIENVLIEGPSTKNPNELAGRTHNMRYVNFPVPAGLDRADLIGRFIDVQVTETRVNSLRGRIAAVPADAPAPAIQQRAFQAPPP